MWVRFTADWTWRPTPRTAVAFRAGMVLRVTRACAIAALAAGKAEPAAAPDKQDHVSR